MWDIFIKDHISFGNLDPEKHPIEKMVTGPFASPLKIQKSHDFWAENMNLPSDISDGDLDWVAQSDTSNTPWRIPSQRSMLGN